MANTTTIELLRQGSEIWNRWRDEHPGERPDLREADLAGLDLNNCDLRECDLFGATLKGANLTHVNFGRSYLSNAVLDGADLTSANLGKANLFQASLVGANLSGADLYEAVLYEANLSLVNLSRSKLSKTNLREANLNKADISGAYLANANLAGANLRKCSLSKANLYGANLERADLYKADLSDAVCFEARFVGANMEEASLERANLASANLSKADLARVNLTGSRLNGCRIYQLFAPGAIVDDVADLDLIISPEGRGIIAVAHWNLAQALILLTNGESVDLPIDVQGKIVPVVGCSEPERAVYLQTIIEAIDKEGYYPVRVEIESELDNRALESFARLISVARVVVLEFSDSDKARPYFKQVIASTPPVPLLPVVSIWESNNALRANVGKYVGSLEFLDYNVPEELERSTRKRFAELGAEIDTLDVPVVAPETPPPAQDAATAPPEAAPPVEESAPEAPDDRTSMEPATGDDTPEEAVRSDAPETRETADLPDDAAETDATPPEAVEDPAVSTAEEPEAVSETDLGDDTAPAEEPPSEPLEEADRRDLPAAADADAERDDAPSEEPRAAEPAAADPEDADRVDATPEPSVDNTDREAEPSNGAAGEQPPSLPDAGMRPDGEDGGSDSSDDLPDKAAASADKRRRRGRKPVIKRMDSDAGSEPRPAEAASEVEVEIAEPETAPDSAEVPADTAVAEDGPIRTVVLPEEPEDAPVESTRPRSRAVWMVPLILLLLAGSVYLGNMFLRRDLIVRLPAGVPLYVTVDGQTVFEKPLPEGDAEVRIADVFVGSHEIAVYPTQLGDMTAFDGVRFRRWTGTASLGPGRQSFLMPVRFDTLYTIRHVANGRLPNISADGSQLVFLRDSRELYGEQWSKGIYLHDIASGETRQLSLNSRAFYRRQWDRPVFRDGGSRLYMSAYGNGVTRLYRIDTGTGAVERLPIDVDQAYPSFVPLSGDSGIVYRNVRFGVDGAVRDTIFAEPPFLSLWYGAGESQLVFMREEERAGRNLRLDVTWMDPLSGDTRLLFKVFKSRPPYLSSAADARRVAVTNYSGLSREYLTTVALWEDGEMADLTPAVLDGQRTFEDGSSEHRTEALISSDGRRIVLEFASRIYLIDLPSDVTVADIQAANLPGSPVAQVP